MNPVYFLVLLTLLAPLVVIALYFNKFDKSEHTPVAIGATIIPSVILVAIIMAVNSYASRDIETINGFVTTKEINRFECPINTSNPCENGYDCNCRSQTYACGSDSKGNVQYCTQTVCDTCYKYPWEQNFFVGSSLRGDRVYKIARVDARGAVTPPRWSVVKHGDPVSETHSYVNYILAAADSLFAEDGKAEEKYKKLIPEYPQSIYDYYRMDRLVTVGNVKLDSRKWNSEISKILVHLGPNKQANVVVVIAEGVGIDFANAVRRSWRGFKKNDIVVFIGVDSSGNMTWTRTMSWSKAAMVNVRMEAEFLERYQGKPLDPTAITSTIKSVASEHFQRRSMEEFKYLKDDAGLSSTKLIWFVVASILLAAGAVFVMIQTMGIFDRAYSYPYSYGNRSRSINTKAMIHRASRIVMSRKSSRFRP